MAKGEYCQRETVMKVHMQQSETSPWPLLKISELVINSALLLDTFN